MKMFIFVTLLGVGLHGATAVTHSLKYFYTGSSQVPNFPEFVIVGLVDEVQIDHYDSNTRRAEPKQDWANRITEDRADYWERETGKRMGAQQTFKANIEIGKQRFNQTGGVHTYQMMYGCQWDDETQQVNGFMQFGYDGEDFISFNLKSESWIAPNSQAVITKHKWNNNKAQTARFKNYLTQICPEWVKKYLNFGKSFLQRTERPSVSLLQKSPFSPVSCHATGFYPNRATMFWRKDGEELHEGVEMGEILPNNDGSFQMSVDLKRLPDTHEKGKYECVFQLSGVKEDLVTRLNEAVIRTNEEKPFDMTVIIIVAVLVLALALIGAFEFMACKKKKAKCRPSPDNSSELSEKLNPGP